MHAGGQAGRQGTRSPGLGSEMAVSQVMVALPTDPVAAVRRGWPGTPTTTSPVVAGVPDTGVASGLLLLTAVRRSV